MMYPAEGFIPEKYRFIMVCVDSYQGKLIKGRVYNPYARGKVFDNLMQLLLLLDELLDQSAFPQKYLEMRSFANQENKVCERVKPIFEEVEKVLDGRLATFKLRIIFRKNASWQGVCSWLDNETEADFRSGLELIMLLDSALSEVGFKSRDCSVNKRGRHL